MVCIGFLVKKWTMGTSLIGILWFSWEILVVIIIYLFCVVGIYSGWSSELGLFSCYKFGDFTSKELVVGVPIINEFAEVY